MTKDDLKGMTRRSLLKNAALATAGSVLARSAVAAPETRPVKSRVVLVRDARVFDAAGKLRAEVVQEMLDLAVTQLTGAKNAIAAWQTLVRPTDVVGLKTNVWQYIPTTTEVERAITARLEDAGISSDRRSVDDRGVRTNPIFQRATALINARPMRTHHWAGVGSLLKNYIMFAPQPSAYHDDACADLALLWKLPQVAGKTRLNVLVLLTPQFHGVGPHSFNPRYVWQYGGLAVGTDPVAVDSVGLRIIEARRREHFGEDRPFPTPPKHIALADERHGLGNADPARIDLVMLGDRDGRLI